MSRYLLVGLVVVVTVTALYSSFASEPQAVATQTSTPLVRVVKVKPAPKTTKHTFTARVQATTGASLGFTMPGRIQKRLVSSGDEVSKNQALAILDPKPLQNARRAASADVRRLTSQRDQLQRDLTRAQTLAKSSAGSQEDVERLTSALRSMDAGLDAAKAALSESRRQLAESTLRAPFGGVITQVMLDEGDVASAGRPVFSIGQADDSLEVALFLPESIIAQVEPGIPVHLLAPIAKVPPIQGMLTSVAAHASPSTGLFPARIKLPKEASAWRPGLTAQVSFSLEAQPGWLVPLSSVIDPTGESPHVVCVRDKKATSVPIQAVAIRQEGAVVKGQLTPEDVVIAAGHFAVQPGGPVEVAP